MGQTSSELTRVIPRCLRASSNALVCTTSGSSKASLKRRRRKKIIVKRLITRCLFRATAAAAVLRSTLSFAERTESLQKEQPE